MAKSQTAADKRRKPWWLIGLLIVLLSVGSSLGVYFFMSSQSMADSEVQEPEAPVQPPVPVFVTVNPFTVNLQSDYDHRLLYVGLSLRVGDESTREFLMEHMPEVRSRLLLLLSNQQAEELVTAEGKQQLTRQILAIFDTPMSEPQPPLAVNDVLFSDFIVQ
ncbi:flagellar basal body-associated protein FliL [Halomonas sp. WWR20]